jgi:hypothetical protein
MTRLRARHRHRRGSPRRQQLQRLATPVRCRALARSSSRSEVRSGFALEQIVRPTDRLRFVGDVLGRTGSLQVGRFFRRTR